MSHSCQQCKLRFEPRNPIFHVFSGSYFLSLFFEHPVDQTSLKWLTVAMPLLETSKRKERDKTRVRLV